MLTIMEIEKIATTLDLIYVCGHVNVNVTKSSSSCLFGPDNKKNTEKWKIFSFHPINSNDEKYNILYLLLNIISQNEYDYEILLWSIHIYNDICVEYANMIDSYVYLFASIYISVNVINEKYIRASFLTQIFGIDIRIGKKMVKTIDDYVDRSDIYFGVCEKKKIIELIKVA